MATSRLHTLVADLAKDSGGMLLSKDALERAVLNSLASAAFSMQGATVETLNEKVSARFDGLSISEGDLEVDLELARDVERPERKYVIRVGPKFDLKLTLHATSKPDKVFSEIAFAVSEILFDVSGRGSQIALTLRPPTIRAAVRPASDSVRKDALDDSQLLSEDLLRIEGPSRTARVPDLSLRP